MNRSWGVPAASCAVWMFPKEPFRAGKELLFAACSNQSMALTEFRGTGECLTGRTSNRVGQLGARYHDSRRSLRPGLLSDYDLNVTVKGIKKMHKALHGKPLQPIIHQSGNLRLIDVEQACRRSLR